MNEWKVILATIVIFGAGVVTGGLLVNYAVHPHAFHAPPEKHAAANTVASTNSQPKNVVAAKPHLPEILSKQFVDQLDCELQLTMSQRADIDRIIVDGQEDMRKAVTDVRLEARQKIREKLTPEQKRKFDDLFKQMREQKKAANATRVDVLMVTNAPAGGMTNN